VKKLQLVVKIKKLRIANCRTGEIEMEIEVPQNGGKGFNVVWCGRLDYVFVAGFNKLSQRMYSLIDTKNVKILASGIIDTESAIMLPIYDEDVNVAFLIGKGSRTMHTFEITDKDPYVFKLNVSQFTNVVYGFDKTNKQDCDVKNTELMKLYILTGIPPTTITTSSVYVPRVRLEYFQDDIYPDTRLNVPTYTTDEWKEGKIKDIQYISLQPEGMKKLSEAPPENDRAKYSYERERQRIEQEEKEKRDAAIFDRVFDRMNEIRETLTDEENTSSSWSDD